MSIDHRPLVPSDRLLSRLLTVDERAWCLWEFDKAVERQGMHRFQKITVRRGDYQCDFVKDLGPSFLFPKASPFSFFSMNMYSVGEVMEKAEWLREGQPPEDGHEPTDLLGEYKKELDEKLAQKAHRSVSGPFIHIERY